MAKAGICKINVRPTSEPVHLLVEHPERSNAQIDKDVLAAIRACYLGEKPWPLLIWGGPGRGKTCAALSFLDRGVGPYFTVPSLCQVIIDCQHDKIRAQDIWALSNGKKALVNWSSSWNNPQVSVREFWEHMAQWPIVVLDELGVREQVSDAHREAVKLTLDARASKVLILCSNREPKTLGSIYGQAVLSRIQGGSTVHAGGIDRRPEAVKKDIERLKAEASAALPTTQGAKP